MTRRLFTRFNFLRSVRSRLLIVLLLSASIPLFLIGISSYTSIYGILNNKIEEGIRNNLRQVHLSFENALSQLNHVSQQLSFEGSIGQNLREYLLSEDLYKRKQLYDNIVRELNLINFTNPSLGLIFYYLPDHGERIYFADLAISQGFSFEQLPVLADYTDRLGFTYYGPHRTVKKDYGYAVLSVSRELTVLDDRISYVFIETEFKLIEEMMNSDQSSMHASYLVVDNQGIITYSENVEFQVGERYSQRDEHAYVSFEQMSTQGWKLVSLIPKSEYNREMNQWIVRAIWVGLASVGMSILFAWIIWRTMYHPMRRLHDEISAMSQSRFDGPIRFTQIKEFDFLLSRFQDMREKVSDLIKTVEEKEQRKAYLEVEKLMYQINPHFIHNTLDTIRWLARMSGQSEIDRLISTLNRLLYYNLGKGETATIEDEIQALEDYVALQQIRYNFQFDVRIYTDPELKRARIPRFVLQPLVENALYHGEMMDDGMIQVHIQQAGPQQIQLVVEDNGVGMTPEQSEKLLTHQEDRVRGMGIGLHYVKQILGWQFGADSHMSIESQIGKGTAVRLMIPLQLKEDGPL